MLKFGIDNAPELPAALFGRAALFTNHTGVNSEGLSSIDVLRRVCDLRLLLAPEHGIRGSLAAGEAFSDGTDPISGLPVISAYSPGSQHLPDAVFDWVDSIIYDLQDVGCRYYTYISSLKILIEDCAKHKKRLIVLDRPNPLGTVIDGSAMQPALCSFVGCHDIPVRYGLTCGEFARLIRGEMNIPCELHVIACEGLTAGMSFPDWGMEWLPPSPNLRSFEAALLYPGTCLFEGTNISEGRGTDAPFCTFGAPFIDSVRLLSAFHRLGIEGVSAEEAEFTPSGSKYAGEHCEGLRLRVTDGSVLRSPALGVRLLDLLRILYPGDFRLLPPSGGDTVPFISRLAGHRLLEDPDWTVSRVLEPAAGDTQVFTERAGKYRMYD